MPSKEYWDTCLWIAYLQDKPEEKVTVDIIDALVRGAQQPVSERMIVVSTLVLAEIRYRDDYDQRRWRVIRDIFYKYRPYIRVIVLNPRLADLASTIGSDHVSLTPPDAVHVATALSEKVDVFYTLDGLHTHGKRRRRDLLRYDGKVGKPALSIKAPQMPTNTQLVLVPDERRVTGKLLVGTEGFEPS